MDRDVAYREIGRLIEHFRTLPAHEVSRLSELGSTESEVISHNERITFYTHIRKVSDNEYLLDITAFGNNWWRHERMDESVVISPKSSEIDIEI
jgi:hypothetical protein